MKIIICCLCIVSVLFTMCENQTDKKDAIGFSLLNGKNYILKVDRVLNKAEIPFPHSNLQESDYIATTEPNQYHITFSENGETINIESGSALGQKTNDGEEYKQYELVEGVFAGGRLVVWMHDNDFEAELTIYGSGVPIVKSERGNLELTEE